MEWEGGVRTTSLVIVPGPEGEGPTRLCEEGSPVLSVQFCADFAGILRQVVLDGLPVGMLDTLVFHGGFTQVGRLVPLGCSYVIK